MGRRTAVLQALAGTMLFVGCQNQPQAPTPVSPTQIQSQPPQPNPPPISIAGSYDMTLKLGSTCSVVPEAERTRTYTATLGQSSAGRNLVTLATGTFLDGRICTFGTDAGCNQFFVSEESSTVRFSLENHNDDGHGGHIVERTSAGTWLEIIGDASGNLDSSAPSIEASGRGHVWYCSTALSYPFPCAAFAGCEADLQLTFTRK
jgi:hypothetical protein